MISGVQFLTAVGARPAVVCGVYTVYTMSPLLIEKVRSVCDGKTGAGYRRLPEGWGHWTHGRTLKAVYRIKGIIISGPTQDKGWK